MTLLSRLRHTLDRFPKLGAAVRRLTPPTVARAARRLGGDDPIYPVRKLAYHDGAYRNRAASGDRRPGCNLIGFARAEFGIGEHLRGVARAFEATELDFSIHDYDRTLHRQEDSSLAPRIDASNPHQANVFCINSNGILDLWERHRSLFTGRYQIGYGFWELSDFPEPWLPVMNVLDEIWAPSRYVQAVVAEKTAVPVIHMPLAVEFDIPGQFSRRDFGLPEDQRVFLFTFDFSSRIQRKNPGAVVEAFGRAFPADRRDVTLVLKTKTVESVLEQVTDRSHLIALTREDDRIRLIDETYPRAKILDLIACCDVYVSLHRAEGFGLGMAEAMRMGKPVIATGYSGNEDFTRPDNACLVDHSLIAVEPGENYDLEGDSVWADPDVDQAADHMRRLADDPRAAAAIGRRGQRTIEEQFSARAVGERYRRRLERIGLL